MEIGLSALVWIAIIFIIIRYWKNIFNFIGGLIYLFIVILIGLFLVLNFTNLNLDRYIDLSFYDDIRQDSGGYLVEKKDNAFDKAIETKDKINNIGNEEEVSDTVEDEVDNKENNKGTETDEGNNDSNEGFSNVTTVEESNINFNDESREEEGEDEDNSEEVNDSEEVEEEEEEVKEGKATDEGVVPYKDLDSYLETIDMKEDTKNLVRNLSPYVTWEYDDGEWTVESTKEGVKFGRR